jgi:hypothetical protein
MRSLGSLEQLFWLLDQNSPVHFALAAQVKGQTTIEEWRNALAAVQKRHPLLSVSIKIDKKSVPYFYHVEDTSIPLRVVQIDNADLNWETELGKELSIPFNAVHAPLVRAVLLHEPQKAILIILAHHAIADGVSIAFVIRDVLQAMAGQPVHPLPLTPSKEELLSILDNHSDDATAAPSSVPTKSARPTVFRKKDGSIPRTQRLRLAPGSTTQLRERARREGTTVHGALCSAVALACRQIATDMGDNPIRIFSPTDTRKLLELTDQCTLSIGFAVTSFQLESQMSLWDLARYTKGTIVEALTLKSVSVSAKVLQVVSGRLNVPGAAQLMAHRVPYEVIVSNLGSLPFESRFGKLQLEALWGPAVFLGYEVEHSIGVATTDGALCLLYASYNPAKRLLETMERILVSEYA